MNISNKLSIWELQKAMYLITCANDLNMTLSDLTYIDVNIHSGYTYLYDENYNFTLYMPINCDLIKSDVYVLYCDNHNGDETETTLNTFINLKEIEIWCDEVETAYIKNRYK